MTKMRIKSVVLFYGVSLVVGLYTTFVLTILWGWFVVPAFHLNPISFWVMYGLTLTLDLFHSSTADIDGDHRHKILAVMLDACVPADKREDVREQLQEFTDQIWYEAGWKVFGKVIGNSMALAVGFVVHQFAS